MVQWGLVCDWTQGVTMVKKVMRRAGMLVIRTWMGANWLDQVGGGGVLKVC